ncbi:MAG: tetratricopeptide repeat protein [Luteolibacter sp.]|uniref:tetratricopeptide repeat protein n=1 Tax=Luteolibacter sp. TaxID=1962973 RepID=UPI003266BDDA
MKRALALLFLASGPLVAQVAPKAEPVDPSLSPDAGNDYFLRGKNLYDSAQASTVEDNRRDYYQRAAVIFADYLNSFPNHPNAEMAWWYLGNSYYQSGQIDDGKRCFSTLLNRFGKGKWAGAAAYTLAADYYNNGQYAFAAPLFERYAENASKPEERPRGNYLAGNCYRLLGRDNEAINSFKKVISDPAGALFAPQAKVAMGHLSLKAGKLQEALTQFEEVIAGPYQSKARGEAALYASLTATKLGQTDLAEKYLKLIVSTPGMEDFRPDAQTALMENCFAKKQYKEVIEIFRRSTLKGDGEKEANRLMIAGRAYMRLNQYSEALQLFRDVEKLVKPETDMAFHAAYNRLLCFFQIEGRNVPDQVDAFLQLYRKSRPEDSRIHTALMMKAETMFSNNQVAEAAKIYSEINAGAVSEKNRPGLLYQRGWCLSEAGDAQGSVRSLSEFISKYPNDSRIPSALAKRAKAYVESAETAKAIIDFDKLTSSNASEDLASYAWLESAHLRRTEGNIPDMIIRYQGLLKSIKSLDPNLEAEANYWIGWGLVKTNAAKDSISYLEKARSLRPDAYAKHAGLLLALGYFASQDPQKLAAEINLAIQGKYEADLPDQAIQWSGMQSYNAGDYTSAAKSLALVANPKEPRETAKEIWRYLAKARLETGDGEGALTAVNNVLAVEDNPGWKADGLLDRGRALLLLKRNAEARVAADEAEELHPQGRTSAGLRILSGDLGMQAKQLDAAGADYLNVISFHEDKDLKPLAISKYIQVLIAQGKTDEVEKYRQQLKNDFPDWKEPAH